MKKSCAWAYVLTILSAVLAIIINLVATYRFGLSFLTILTIIFAIAFLIFAIKAKNKLWASICALVFLAVSFLAQWIAVGTVVEDCFRGFMINREVGEYIEWIIRFFNRSGEPAFFKTISEMKTYVVGYYAVLSLPSLVLGLVGSIKLILVHNKNKAVLSPTQIEQTENVGKGEQTTISVQEENPVISNEKFEYENDDVVKQVLSDEVDEIVAYYENVKVLCIKMGYIYSKASGEERLYALVAPTKDATNKMRVVVYDPNKNAMVAMSEYLCDLERKVFEEWRQAVNAISLSKIEFEDKPIGEKEWKQFRKCASQEDLAVLAIGARFKETGKQFFIRALIAVVGTILSIVLGLADIISNIFGSDGLLGVVIVIGGYLFFNSLAVKLTSYSSTYKDCYKRLTAENKAYVDSFFDEKGAVAILKELVVFGLMFFTLPYRAILMFIGTMMPSAEDWCVAHGGMGGTFVTLPKGYDVGSLREVGEYYESCKFVDAWVEESEKAKKERELKVQTYQYTDENGITKTAYSNDGKNFYSSSDLYFKVGESNDGGQNIDTSKR